MLVAVWKSTGIASCDEMEAQTVEVISLNFTLHCLPHLSSQRTRHAAVQIMQDWTTEMEIIVDQNHYIRHNQKIQI